MTLNYSISGFLNCGKLIPAVASQTKWKMGSSVLQVNVITCVQEGSICVLAVGAGRHEQFVELGVGDKDTTVHILFSLEGPSPFLELYQLSINEQT